MKYKVGDKVKVRSDLEVNKCYGTNGFVNDMAIWKGKVAVIDRVLDNGEYRIVNGDFWNWTDEMFEESVKEEGKLYASELMELARKNPQEYEGKRYRVDGFCCIDPKGKSYFEVTVDSNGNLQGKDYDNWAYINSHTELEEIKPEPKPVSFIEAVNSGKRIKHQEWEHFVSPITAMHYLSMMTNQQIIDRINAKEWFVEG